MNLKPLFDAPPEDESEPLPERVLPELTPEGAYALRLQLVHEVKSGRTVKLDRIAYVLGSTLTSKELAAYDGWPVPSVLRDVFKGPIGEKLASIARAQLATAQAAERKRARRTQRFKNEARRTLRSLAEGGQ